MRYLYYYRKNETSIKNALIVGHNLQFKDWGFCDIYTSNK